jgi:pyruvate,orthophosphate dikinase
VPLADLEAIDKTSYVRLMEIMQTLEEHYRDLCDIEFTVERGKLWMLQTRWASAPPLPPSGSPPSSSTRA